MTAVVQCKRRTPGDLRAAYLARNSKLSGRHETVPREKMRTARRDERLRMYAIAARQGNKLNFKATPGGDGLVSCGQCGGTIDFCEGVDGDITLVHVEWTGAGWVCSQCTRGNRTDGKKRVAASKAPGDRRVRLPSYLGQKQVGVSLARLSGEDGRDAAGAGDA